MAFVTMGLGVKARTAFSLLFPPILDEFGWERGMTAGVFSGRRGEQARYFSCTPHSMKYYDMSVDDLRQVAGVVMIVSIRCQGMRAAPI
jgi:hypothetical protein